MNILPSCQEDSLSSSLREIQLCQNQFPVTKETINKTSLLLIGPNLNVTTVELMGISPMNAGSPKIEKKENASDDIDYKRKYYDLLISKEKAFVLEDKD